MQVAHATINKATVNLVENVINLEGGDALKMQADTGNEITGQISYLLIDRSQENG